MSFNISDMQPLSKLLLSRSDERPLTLGRLETDVLRILWNHGESSVREVLAYLERPLAYTTVMTTLDRLFKKGLLARRMNERSFRYIPQVPTQKPASGKISLPSRSSQAARNLLVSHLVDTVCEYDATLLDELERDIAERKRRLKQQPGQGDSTNGGAR